MPILKETTEIHPVSNSTHRMFWSLSGELKGLWFNMRFCCVRQTDVYRHQVYACHQKCCRKQSVLVKTWSPTLLNNGFRPHVANASMEKNNALGFKVVLGSVDLTEFVLSYIHMFGHFDNFIRDRRISNRHVVIIPLAISSTTMNWFLSPWHFCIADNVSQTRSVILRNTIPLFLWFVS